MLKNFLEVFIKLTGTAIIILLTVLICAKVIGAENNWSFVVLLIGGAIAFAWRYIVDFFWN